MGWAFARRCSFYIGPEEEFESPSQSLMQRETSSGLMKGSSLLYIKIAFFSPVFELSKAESVSSRMLSKQQRQKNRSHDLGWSDQAFTQNTYTMH
jgi:hypothetical protein